jgi:aminoglycoside phosphotransferase (APT) family kinase protein
MTTVDARYLLEIKDAMMAGLRTPGHSSATRQRLVYGHRLLARFLVREQVEGTLRSRADAHFAEFGGRLAAPGAPPGTLTQAAWTQSRGALQEVAEIELECCKTVLRAIEEATAEPPPGDAGPGALTAAETAALTRFLRTAFPEEADISAGASRTVPGGFSKQTLFVELQHARQLPATVVLRMDRPDAVVVSTVMDEYQILRQLHEAGVAVPQPFALEAAGNVLRGRFIVMSKIEGHNPGDAMDVTEADPDLACDLARVLARIHRIPAESFGPGVTGARQSTQERLLADIARAQANWAAIDLQSPSLDIALSWLKNHAGDVAGTQRSLIHRDLGSHNMLAHEGRIAALLDWELAAIGSPAEDLGYVYDTVCQMTEWDRFMAAYAQAGGTVPPAGEVAYYALWANVWVEILLMQCGAAFDTGATDNTQLGYCGEYLLPRMQVRTRTKLAGILQRHILEVD